MLGNKWMEYAIDDIDSAEIMMQAKKYNNVCYFAHQATEKALKSILVLNGITPPKIHNLVDLIRQSEKYCSQLSKFLPYVRTLNQFYIPTRYPIAPFGSTKNGMPDKTLALKALNYATEIVEECQKIMERVSDYE